MAISSEKWFFRNCLAEERRRSPLSYLASKGLDLGFNRENTSGHIRQAVGAAQLFLKDNPAVIPAIKRMSPVDPLDLAGAGILADWLAYFGAKAGKYSRGSFGYNWDTLRGYLTPSLGGYRAGGGGGDDEFRIVMRLAAEFI